MKEYKMVYLNKELKLTRDKDLEQAEAVINQYVADGWVLQQVVSSGDMIGALFGVFYREI